MFMIKQNTAKQIMQQQQQQSDTLTDAADTKYREKWWEK